MLIKETYRKCASYICVNTTDDDGAIKTEPRGTVFFVGFRENPNRTIVYAVTARHVIVEANRYNQGKHYDRIFLRLNKKDGTAEDVPFCFDAWFLHEDTDVAIARLRVDFLSYDHTFIEHDLLLDSQMVRQKKIAEGDQVFFAGLFSKLSARERSTPIVRFGRISMMPGERVQIRISRRDTIDIDAYLIESLSWGGVSGSPAFWEWGPLRHEGVFMTTPKDHPHVYLLGIVCAHFDIDQDADLSGDFKGTPGRVSVPLNAGIAVVVPAQGILDMLNREDVAGERKPYS